MTISTRRMLAAFVALALLLAACGGDDDAGGATTTDAPAATTTDTTAATTTTASSENDSGDDGAIDMGGIFTGECQEAVAGVAAAMNAYTTGLAEAFGGQIDEEELQASADELRALAGAAPDELKDDLEVIAAALADFYGAFAEIGFDPTSGQAPTPEQAQKLAELSARFEETGFQEASDNVNAWFEAHCN